MEKRVLLAVFLSFLVLFVYQSLFVSRQTPVSTLDPDEATQTAAPATSPQPQPELMLEPEREAAPDAISPGESAVPVIADAAAREIVVENEDIRAVFSTRGAVLASWRLKRYFGADGQPLELVVSPDGEGGWELPFSIDVGDPAVTQRLAEALFLPNHDHVEATDGPVELTFRYEEQTGLQAKKVFGFDPATPFVVRFSVTVDTAAGPQVPTVGWGPGPGSAIAIGEGGGYQQGPQAIYYRDGDMSRLDSSDVREQPEHTGAFGFAGIDDHYFLSAAVLDGTVAQMTYAPVPRASEPGIELMAFALALPSPPVDLPFFIGPKDFDLLASVDPDLVRAVDFGIFSFLVVPLHRSLKWVYAFVENYGWSIIILTILINAAMFPLRHKSVVSMRKMQEIQPEVKAIQDRYRNLKTTDPARQKMNAELMGLYRERGVNPASGCLPMLLTMPVLFAFYSLLSVAIEIRGAPFVLWITDLSQHDPLYITPLLMGATMVAQQRMTPSTADPTQQKVMMFMPIVFTFMFLWAPSGLVLYWLVSNLWGVGQQVVTNRIIGPPVVRQVRPPAERRVKQRAPKKAGATPKR